MITRWLGRKLLTRRWTSLAREAVACTFLVAMLFTLVCTNLSFNRVFYEAQGATLGGRAVIVTNDSIAFLAPTDKWVWNASQLVLDQATLKLMEPLRAGFTASVFVLGFTMLYTRISEAYKEAKRDNEQFRGWMGTLYAIGVRREDIFGAFLLERGLGLALGLVCGTALSVAFMIPYILGEFAGSGMNLFFRNISETYPAGAVASAMFVSLSLCIKVNTLRTGTGPKTLLRFRKD